MKYLLYLSPLFLVGCALTEWLLKNEESVSAGSSMAEGFGPYGAIAGFGATTLLGFAKWYEHKASAKEIILSTQAAKNNLPEDAKQKLKDGYNEYMPEKVKKYVSKVKNSI